MTEKYFKVGEYGYNLRWALKNDAGGVVDDLLTATSIKIYFDLNGTVTTGNCELVDPATGVVSWTVPQGVLIVPGTAKIEIEATYPTGIYITNTFQEKVQSRVKRSI